MTRIDDVLDELAHAYPYVNELRAPLMGLAPLLKQVGLRLMDADEVREVRAERSGEAANPYDNLLFFIADPGGHYLGTWIRGALLGRLSWYHPDEIDLCPEWRSLASLRTSIETRKPDVDFYSDLKRDLPDVEGRATADERASDLAVIAKYRTTFAELSANEEEDPTWLFFFASTIMQVTPCDHLDEVMAFLDHPNDYIQERAALILGAHRHAPARAKLEAIATNGSGNARLAAKGVLERL